MVPRSRTRSATLASAVLALALVGCSGTTDRPPQPQESARESSSGGVSPPAERLSPFTGLPAERGPVLAVKIDNVGPARPHTGLEDADLVYVEQVESGQSRILAVFSSQLPQTVGPVRSARESDIELLRQFDQPALAFSGAQSRLIPLLEQAPLLTMAPGEAPEAYFRESSRASPHNLYLRPQELLDQVPDAGRAGDIGFRFGAPPPVGEPTDHHTVRFPTARFTFSWSPEETRWLVTMDGEPATNVAGERLGAATVVIQRTTVRPSDFHDGRGNVSPYTETVGSGSAVVLRDGKAHQARWQRDSEEDGTTFTTPSGKPLRFAEGSVWVLYEAL